MPLTPPHTGKIVRPRSGSVDTRRWRRWRSIEPRVKGRDGVRLLVPPPPPRAACCRRGERVAGSRSRSRAAGRRTPVERACLVDPSLSLPAIAAEGSFAYAARSPFHTLAVASERVTRTITEIFFPP